MKCPTFSISPVCGTSNVSKENNLEDSEFQQPTQQYLISIIIHLLFSTTLVATCLMSAGFPPALPTRFFRWNMILEIFKLDGWDIYHTLWLLDILV